MQNARECYVGSVSTAQPMTLRGRRVVRELRQLRATRGLSLDAVAELTGLSPATVSRIENREEGRLRTVNVRALLDAYGVDAGFAERMLQWTRESQHRGWWASVDDTLMSAPYKDLAALEEETVAKLSVEPLFVPGLLQTEEYASAVLAALDPELTETQRDELVEVRIRRQERLGMLELKAVIPEEVLHRPVGGPEAMGRQLRHLLEATERTRTTLSVVPYAAGAHIGMRGGFSILGFEPPDEDVVYVEASSGEACFESTSVVEDFRHRFAELSGSALGPAASRRLIAQALALMERS